MAPGLALVNMLSVFSLAAGAGTYRASKAALWSLTKSLRLEVMAGEHEVLVDRLTEQAKAALAGPVGGLPG